NGWYKTPALPTVVTMNKAHSSHYTMHPEPGIAHVLRGWDEASATGADHDLVVDDVYIRNVPTDIRSWGGRDGAERQLDLHLRGGGTVHRPSRPPAPRAHRRAICRDRPARRADGAGRRRAD